MKQQDKLETLKRVENDLSDADARESELLKVLRQFGGPIAMRLINRTIRTLRKMPSASCSNLQNAWEDLCVQVQFQESVTWDAYLATIAQVLAQELRGLSVHETQALWLLTDPGEDWDFDKRGDSVPWDDAEITEYLTQRIVNDAANYTNRRIEVYLSRSSEFA